MNNLTGEIFGTEKIWKILLKIAPPVMLSQLIQALYNIVDSYFVGKLSGEGLTALSAIFPIQLLITAIAVGNGVGVNTYMARLYALGKTDGANKTAGTGAVLAVISWAVFAVLAAVFLRPVVEASVQTEAAAEYAMIYGGIVCMGSLGTFLESCFTKVHQAGGNMRIPMIAQIAGAVVNIILDPILIFGMGPFPEMGIAGAAVATVCGQYASAVIVGIKGFRRPPKAAEMKEYIKPIYSYGIPYVCMQAFAVIYIVVVNAILAGFSDAAVTVLGLYFKLQTFFFIPLFALQTCIVPVLSYNYSRADYRRCRTVVNDSVWFSMALMLVGVICFEGIPGTLIGLFSKDYEVLAIGVPAFRIIGLSFFPAAISQMSPVIFQAIGRPRPSILLGITRPIFCLIPIFWALSRLGLSYVWFAFLATELITGTVGIILYIRETRMWTAREKAKNDKTALNGKISPVS